MDGQDLDRYVMTTSAHSQRGERGPAANTLSLESQLYGLVQLRYLKVLLIHAPSPSESRHQRGQGRVPRGGVRLQAQVHCE